MLNFNSVLIFSEDPKSLGEFYKKVFDQKPEMEQEGGYYGFLVGKGFISIGPHSEVKGKNSDPKRLIFNLETHDVKGEFERIKGLAAKVIAEPYEIPGMSEGSTGTIATFADPDDNYFQLVTPWDELSK